MPNVGLAEIAIVIAILGVFVLLGLAVIVLLVWLFHRTQPATTPPRDPALEDLRARFARGDIDEAEYRRLLAILQGS
jgi:uncharacterized membrane protein